MYMASGATSKTYTERRCEIQGCVVGLSINKLFIEMQGPKVVITVKWVPSLKFIVIYY